MMSRQISSENENEGGVVNLKQDDSCNLGDHRVNEGNAGDLEFPRSSHGRIRVLPARFRDSVVDLGKKRKPGESRVNIGVNIGRKRMPSDIESKGSLRIHDNNIRHDSSLSLADVDEQGMASDAENKPVREKKRKNRKAEENDFYRLENIQVGDVVWARYSKRALAWPALVIDPLKDAPKSVFSSWVPNIICVIFLGYSKKGGREYGWIKKGMIYPYDTYLDRFQRQCPLSGSNTPSFFKAVEEAILYGYGYNGTGVTSEDHVDTGHKYTDDSTASCQDLEFDFDKLCKSKQYCGICKKIWHQSNGGNWICCDGCGVWVHAECAEILDKPHEEEKYFCPKCDAMTKLNCEASTSKRPAMDVAQAVVPDHLSVICTGIEGIYYPAPQLVECKCGSCGTHKWKLCQWERHTGSRNKKWKVSVKVKDSMLSLGKWMSGHNLQGVYPSKLSKQQLFTFLQEKYEPVCSKWSLGRCAVCRQIEDHGYDKIIICNRCQIAVHQECYGVSSDDVSASWVCRACEVPDTKRECCLCPIKGGALKPTNVDTLWVHVTCAWFRPEVYFIFCQKMEPAVGILDIPPDSFVKACSLCKQIHGSCIHCCKCKTSFHAMCALQAGFHMEMRSSDKRGKQIDCICK